ncbi:MAG: EscU/YscU/HrcU family type III secretion system export apparatus switch protein [Pseudomonadota bacterium]
MAEEQSSQDERTQDPSEQKLRKAVLDGQVSKSSELTGLGAWSFGVLGLAIFGPSALQSDLADLRAILAQSHVLGLTGQAPLPALPWRFGALLFGLMTLGALLGGGLQPGRPSLKPVAPKLSKLSPLSYLSNRFGAKGLLDYARNAVKAAGFALIAGLAVAQFQIGLFGAFELEVDTKTLLGFLRYLAAWVIPLMVMFSLVDLMANKRFDRKKLRVTPQEEKREAKEEGGDPERKARQRAQAQALSTQNLPIAVPKADVVIANPTHFAVCLSWSRAKGSAPICTAKGQDEVALTIRRIAAQAGVPIYHHPSTARALFSSIALDQEIPPELYQAVAAAIRFADELKGKSKKPRR